MKTAPESTSATKGTPTREVERSSTSNSPTGAVEVKKISPKEIILDCKEGDGATFIVSLPA